MDEMGFFAFARYWFKHYPSDIFITGHTAEIRKHLACMMIERHKNKMERLKP